MMAVAELGGGAAFLPSEDAVEVAHVVVSAFEADLGNGVGGVDQHPCGIAQAYVYDVVAQPPSGVQFEEAAEGALAHIGQVGQRLESQFVLVVVGDVFLHAEDATAVVFDVHLGVAGGGEGACIRAQRQRVEDVEELHQRREAVGDLAQSAQLAVDLHDGRHGERQSFLCFFHHAPYALERCLAEELVVVRRSVAEVELDGDLTDVFALALVLFPSVFE